MTNIAILTPSLVDGDAVGNDVIGMQNVLAKHDYTVQVFAEGWSTSTTSVKHVSEVKDFVSRSLDILIYHYSVGWDAGLNLLQTLKCQKVIKYHNVTPPSYYENISIDFVHACKAGREQLALIADIPGALYLSDSQYNASELLALGVHESRSSVLPPFHYIDQLHCVACDFTVLDRFVDGRFNILMVGRVVPNKGHSSLIDAFNVYYKNYNRSSRLLIVGKEDDRLETYNKFLHAKVKDLGLEEAVIFTGGVSVAELKSYYLASDAFMITSEHEGFCVPLVEAMSAKIPIVAYGSTAIPATVGKAGLVWEQPDPFLLAGSLNHIANNESISVGLGELGWQRYQAIFTNEKIEAQFLEFMKSLE